MVGALGLFACRERVQQGLSEREANALKTVLLERGVPAHKVDEGRKKPSWALEVDRQDASEAIRVLAELGLPKVDEAQGCDGLGGGLVRSPLEEQVCRMRALERGVEKTLEAGSGVLTARVHLVAPGAVRWGQPPRAAKASVFLRVLPGRAYEGPLQRESVRALVSGAVEGLEPASVSLWVDEVKSPRFRREGGGGALLGWQIGRAHV